MTRYLFVSLFFFSCIVFFCHLKVVGNAVYGDGAYYYSYVNSFVVNHTFPPPNKYSLMPSLFWLVPYFFVYLMKGGNGLEYIYQFTVGITSIFFGFLGLYLSFLTLTKYFSKWVSLLSILGIWVTTHLFFYIVLDPINSHSVSFFTSSLLIYLITTKMTMRKLSTRTIFFTGIVAGVLTLIRNHDGIVIIPLAITCFIKERKKVLMLIAGFLPVVTLQLIIWFLVSGTWNSPYIARGEKFFWSSPHFFGVLFDNPNGLLLVSPILIFSIGGLIYGLNKYILARMGIVLLLMQTFVLGSWEYWQGGAAYGGRMFISLMPFFAFGLAVFLSNIKQKSIQIILLSLFTLFNMMGILLFLITNP